MHKNRYRSFKDVSSTLERPQSLSKTLVRIGYITMFCVICFICRAVIMILEIFDYVNTGLAWALALYYIFLELIPLSTMAYLLIATIIKPNSNTWHQIN